MHPEALSVVARRPRKTRSRLAASLVIALLGSGLGIQASAGPVYQQYLLGHSPESGFDATAHPALDARLAALARTPSRTIPGRAPQVVGYNPRDDFVAVEITPTDGNASAVERALRNSGVHEVIVLPSAILARVPVSRLTHLADDPAIAWIGTSGTPVADLTGAGVGLIGASPWHAAEATGAGSKVAIIDLGFEGYELLLGSELPGKVHTYDRCGDMGSPEDHGTAVAEIVHEVAPHATLYLMCIENTFDLASAVDYAIEQGVTVINHSVGWFGPAAGRGDGTGTVGDITATAHAAGILWVNSAGNQGQEHWGGTFDDTNPNGWHDFDPGLDETIAFELGDDDTVTIYLRWDAWSGPPVDLNLRLFLDPPEAGILALPATYAGSNGSPPTEALQYTNNSGITQVLHLAVAKVSGVANPEIDLFVFDWESPQYFVAAGSIGDPASAPWVMAVGATHASTGTIEGFSSRGPTISGAIKPNLTAPNRVANATYGSFGGTSASAPHVAGAASLLQTTHSICSPAELHSMLIDQTQEAGGPPIPNNDYGHGRLLLDAPPSPTDPVLRYAGGNRYATAAAISKGDFPCGARTVFIATGENFPDALAGAAAAARYNAPILLVQQGAIPPETVTELERLDPDEIIILGGTAVISATVATQLTDFGSVRRLAGTDRFATARLISSDAFPDTDAVSNVFLANGFGFADALAGGPTAAYRDAPLLLVHHDSIPSDTISELGRLDPDTVWILGGTSVVSQGVADQLASLGYTVQRVAGANRYATAVAASQNAPRIATLETTRVVSHRVYIAVGTNFPDALAGAGVAGIRHAPVLLVQQNSIPQAVIDEIERLNPRQIVILGGTGVVSTAVENQLRALLD